MILTDESLDYPDCRPLIAEPIANPYLDQILADHAAAKRADAPPTTEAER